MFSCRLALPSIVFALFAICFTLVQAERNRTSLALSDPTCTQRKLEAETCNEQADCIACVCYGSWVQVANCRFCPKDAECHAYGSIVNPCLWSSDKNIYYMDECPASPFNCSSGDCVCRTGSNSVQVQPPTFNGCGSGFHVPTPPDWGFEPVCNKHDCCYGTCNMNRDTDCDTPFCNGLVQACLDANLLPDARDECILEADVFCLAVRTQGDAAFQCAQHEDCKCPA